MLLHCPLQLVLFLKPVLRIQLQQRLDPVIGFRRMAANHAGAAVLGLGELYWIGPPAERHLFADMLLLGTGMGAVTCGAGPPLLPVDMQEMHVVLAVTEIGQLGGGFFSGNILVVAAKTEVILGRAVGVIEIHREFPSKKLGIG